MVAPRAASPACASAIASPCGLPPGAVLPRLTTMPSFTTIAPTAGFGQVEPFALAPSRIAAAMKRRSRPSLIRGDAGLAFGKLADERLEIPRLAEIPVDGGEAHIGHGVEILQAIHHQ